MRVRAAASFTPGDWRAWDAYVQSHPGGWFWHTSGWLHYQLAFRPGNEQASFMVLSDDGVVLAVVPLVLVHRVDRVAGVAGPVRELSYSGDPLPLPLSSSPTAAGFALEELRRQARRQGVSKVRFWEHPFCDARHQSLGAHARGVRYVAAAQRVVDGVPAWAEVRASYRSLIHRGQRKYRISSATGDTEAAAALFSQYVVLHRRMTNHPRADATYRLQREWLAAGLALVVVAEDAAGTWGAAYWNAYRGAAYYSSGAYTAPDVGHALAWEALRALAELGVTCASLGWQGTAVSDKERAIEFFKRGFGGADVSCREVVLEVS